jgi:hypothetical protein
MTTVALPQLIDGIKTALSSAASLSGVRIFDGPEIDESYPGDAICVGHDGSEDGEVLAGTANNDWNLVGAKKMFEIGTVNCFLWSWDGDTDISARRTRAYALLSAVDTVIRTDPSFGGVVLYAGLESHSPTYRQTNAGAVVVINFTIAYHART